MSSPDGLTRRIAVLILLAGGLAGLGACGFQPLYGETGTTYAAQDALAQIKVAPLRDRVGQQLRNELIRELTPAGEPFDPAYILKITLIIKERNVFIRESTEVDRKTLTLTARYELRPPGTEGPEEIVFSATAFTEASFNRFDSEFANIRARIDAENRAATEIARQIREQLSAVVASGRA